MRCGAVRKIYVLARLSREKVGVFVAWLVGLARPPSIGGWSRWDVLAQYSGRVHLLVENPPPLLALVLHGLGPC